MTHRRENVELRYRALYVCYARREGGRKRQKQTESKSESKIGREREKAREREREGEKAHERQGENRCVRRMQMSCMFEHGGVCDTHISESYYISVSHTTYHRSRKSDLK